MSTTHSVVAVKGHGVRWRVFEREMCETYMGPIVLEEMPNFITADDIHHSKADTIVWKLNTERTDWDLWRRCVAIADHFPDLKHINDPRGWITSHAKEEAFKIWRDNDIPVPDWFEFEGPDDFWRKVKKSHLEYPFLMRLNNNNTGYDSFLVRDDEEANVALTKLELCMQRTSHNLKKWGAKRGLIAVQFIPTLRPENTIMSFRIIVAADKVVTGYARLGPAEDWIAITGRFESHMEQTFVHYQKVCFAFCQEWEKMLIKSVRVLGLNFQGVDVILDQNDNPYFLEVQPGFSTGYANVKNWNPPFYNPSRPAALVQFLQREKFRLQQEIPFYTNYWLNKYAMFDRAYSALARSLYGV